MNQILESPGATAPEGRPIVAATLRLVGQAVGLALFVWLTDASVHLVGWSEVGGRRIAFLAGFRSLAVALGLCSAVLVVGIVCLARLRQRTFGETASMFDPLMLLWIAVVPYLPLLADELPLTLVVAGGLKWWLAAVTGALVLKNIVRVPVNGVLRYAARPAAVFASFVVIYLGLGTYVSRSYGIGGDEPHYLIITHSLLSDGDLRIENNHAHADYAPFFAGELRPDFVQRGRDGIIYSIHAPGLPLLLLPAYALGGVRGAIVLISILAALGAVGVFRIARQVTSPSVALATTLAVCLSTPYLFHAWMLFPEMPAAVVVAWALVWLDSGTTPGPMMWGLRGLALGGLPWLHTKFALLAPLGLGLAWRLVRERRWRETAALLGAATLTIAAWFYSFHVMYGTPDPTAPYGPASAMGYQLAWANVPRGVLGLLFDQEFGLLPYSPIYLLVGYGAWLGWRDRATSDRFVMVTMVLTVAAFVLGTTRYYMWWGGWSVPARFIIPLLPFAVSPLARAFARVHAPIGRPLVLATSAVTALVVGTMLVWPAEMLMFNDRDGSGSLLAFLDDSDVARRVLPSFLWEDWRTPLRLVVLWATAGGLALTTLAFWCHRRPASRLVHAGRLLGCVMVLGALVTRTGLEARAFDGMIQAGRLRLLTAFDPERRRAIDLTAWRSLGPRQVLSAATLRLRTTPDLSDDPENAVGPIELPPGRYVGLAQFRATRALDGAVRLRFHRSATLLAESGAASERSRRIAFTLPPQFVAPRFWLSLDTRAQFEALQTFEIQPLAVVPRSARPDVVPVATENLGGRPGAYLAYLDRQAFPEGGVFWTRGEGTAEVALVTGGAATARLWFEAGAASGRVSWHVDGCDDEQADMAAGGRLERTLALDRDTASVRIRVGFTSGFRPADVDPALADRRWLGVRVGVELP